MIDITDINLRKFVQTVYDLSRPVGMGYLQYVPGPLSDEYADRLIHPTSNGRLTIADE